MAMRRVLVLAALLALVLGSVSASALEIARADAASFRVCNKTALPTRVALGRFNGAYWTSAGWWSIASKQSNALLPGPLNTRYYCLYS
jgi:uncharacterized membrane protein